MLALAAAAAGFAAATLHTAWIVHPVLRRPAWSVAVRGFVETREERERSDRIVVRTLSVAGRRLDAAPQRVRVAVRTGTAPAVGAFVTFKANLMPPLTPLRPGGYDFARDMYFSKLGASGFVLGGIKVAAPPSQDGGLWLHYAAAVGCIGKLADGSIVAYALEPDAFEDDCVRAALIIAVHADPPPDCAAKVITRQTWYDRGALALRRDGSGFVMESAWPKNYDRPWSPQWAPARHAPTPSAAATKKPSAPLTLRDATPAPDDVEADQ